MHHTLVKSASAVVLASVFTSSLAAVAPRQAVPTNNVTCTDDALYKGFFSNSQIVYDVQTFCSQDLGLTASTICDHSLTARTTIYPSGTSVTRTVTDTTTTYDTTVTVTETGVVYGLPHKEMARNAVPAAEAQITAAPKIVRDILNARAAEKRQGTNSFNANSAAAQVYSTCECGYLAGFVTADTSYVATCYPYTSTVTANQVKYVPTTVFTTAEGSVTTITVTQNYTSNIISAISAMNTTQPQSTNDHANYKNINIHTSIAHNDFSHFRVVDGDKLNLEYPSQSGNADQHFFLELDREQFKWDNPISPAVPSTTSSWTWTETNSNWSSPISPVTPSTTSSWTTTTVGSSTSSPTVQPSGCPYINGTTYTPPGSCDIYTRVCGLSFENKDFYDIFPYYPTPELCTELCEANSNGMSPCLGIVWNTSAIAGSHQSNCRQIRSLSNPITDPTSIALILSGQDPSCNKGVSISSSSTLGVNSTGSPVGPTWTGNTTWNFPTGTGRPSYTHSRNHTRTRTSMNSTAKTYTPSTTSYPNTTLSINSTSISPYMPSTTLYPNTTWSTNVTSMSSTWSVNRTSSGTAPVSPTLSTTNSTCPVATVTSVSTQYATLYNNATVTLDQTTVTVFATNITTVTLTATTAETDTQTTTETDTQTTTETDTETTTETKMATTTETDISTITTTTTTTTTEAAPPRYGRVWHGAWRA